jgi:hypothetical protein
MIYLFKCSSKCFLLSAFPGTNSSSKRCAKRFICQVSPETDRKRIHYCVLWAIATALLWPTSKSNLSRTSGEVDKLRVWFYVRSSMLRGWNFKSNSLATLVSIQVSKLHFCRFVWHNNPIKALKPVQCLTLKALIDFRLIASKIQSSDYFVARIKIDFDDDFGCNKVFGHRISFWDRRLRSKWNQNAVKFPHRLSRLLHATM